MHPRMECKLCGEDWALFQDQPDWNVETLKAHALTSHPDSPWWSLTSEES